MAAKVTEYGIICEGTAEKLVATVTKHIGKGWQPIGGAVSAVNETETRFFMQTLVRSGPEISSSRHVKG